MPRHQAAADPARDDGRDNRPGKQPVKQPQWRVPEFDMARHPLPLAKAAPGRIRPAALAWTPVNDMRMIAPRNASVAQLDRVLPSEGSDHRVEKGAG